MTFRVVKIVEKELRPKMSRFMEEETIKILKGMGKYKDASRYSDEVKKKKEAKAGIFETFDVEYDE